MAQSRRGRDLWASCDVYQFKDEAGAWPDNGLVIGIITDDAFLQTSSYGLASAVFSQNINRVRVAHALEAGMAWINCVNASDIGMPFGGYKQSGVGRECGEYALENYTQVKSVFINLGMNL